MSKNEMIIMDLKVQLTNFERVEKNKIATVFESEMETEMTRVINDANIEINGKTLTEEDFSFENIEMINEGKNRVIKDMLESFKQFILNTIVEELNLLKDEELKDFCENKTEILSLFITHDDEYNIKTSLDIHEKIKENGERVDNYLGMIEKIVKEVSESMLIMNDKTDEYLELVSRFNIYPFLLKDLTKGLRGEKKED